MMNYIGDPKLVIDFISGNWSEKEFLIVNPGGKSLLS